ncbi:uncharacterized protein LOC110346021 [Heterocephalus glaber]|uniref:Uncharacterized protein LOC110346021 n=1 Tax=Heterocephalus glaber TaxID=10181 RepID=A0AAX6RXL6_HETGA|nr:uncharacterized protein LOC110346021 [Heterocephalus glaber]
MVWACLQGRSGRSGIHRLSERTRNAYVLLSSDRSSVHSIGPEVEEVTIFPSDIHHKPVEHEAEEQPRDNCTHSIARDFGPRSVSVIYVLIHTPGDPKSTLDRGLLAPGAKLMPRVSHSCHLETNNPVIGQEHLTGSYIFSVSSKTSSSGKAVFLVLVAVPLLGKSPAGEPAGAAEQDLPRLPSGTEASLPSTPLAVLASTCLVITAELTEQRHHFPVHLMCIFLEIFSGKDTKHWIRPSLLLKLLWIHFSSLEKFLSQIFPNASAVGKF